MALCSDDNRDSAPSVDGENSSKEGIMEINVISYKAEASMLIEGMEVSVVFERDLRGNNHIYYAISIPAFREFSYGQLSGETLYALVQGLQDMVARKIGEEKAKAHRSDLRALIEGLSSTELTVKPNFLTYQEGEVIVTL